MILTKSELDLLESILIYTKEKLGFDTSMEYGCEINDILDKIKKEQK